MPEKTLIDFDELLSHSWRDFTQHLGKLLGMSVLITLPSFILIGLVGFSIVALRGSVTTQIIMSVIIILLLLTVIIVSIWGGAAFIRLTQDLTKSISQVFRSTRNLILPYFLVGLLVSVILLAIALVPMAIGAIGYTIAINIIANSSVEVAASLIGGIIVVVGTILFIRQLINYSFSQFVLVYENSRGMTALQRSQQLVRGHWWGIFGRLLVLWLVIAITQGVLSSILGLATSNDVIFFFFNLIFSLLVAPFSVLYIAHLYRDVAGQTAAPTPPTNEPTSN